MICPNCGAPLPDTVSMCYSCRIKFNNPNALSEKNTGKLVTPPNVIMTNNPIYTTDKKGRKLAKLQGDNKSYFIISCVSGIIGACLATFSLFIPFAKVSVLNISYPVVLSQSGDVAAFLLDILILFIFSLPIKKYVKSDGIVKLIAGAWGVVWIIYKSIKLDDVFKELLVEYNVSQYSDYISYSFSAGWLFLIVGYILFFISGILLAYCVPKGCKASL